MRQQLDTANPAIDLAIAGGAARQHGVVTHRQLVRLGVTPSGVSRRVRCGRLHRLYRGVYAVGHCAPSRERDWMVAVLACGEGAVLSHGSAAVLWGLLRPIEGPIDVSVPSRNGRAKQRGIRLHRRPALASATADGRHGWREGLVTIRNLVPVTTVPLTVVDLRATTPHLVRRATRQAELAGYRIQGVEKKRTRSDLEDDFLVFCRRHGFRRPEVNVRVGPFEVDFVWRAARVAVETDDFRYHRGSVAYEEDHARELELRRRGFVVRRFTGQLIEEKPELVAADLREAFRERG